MYISLSSLFHLRQITTFKSLKIIFLKYTNYIEIFFFFCNTSHWLRFFSVLATNTSVTRPRQPRDHLPNVTRNSGRPVTSIWTASNLVTGSTRWFPYRRFAEPNDAGFGMPLDHGGAEATLAVVASTPGDASMSQLVTTVTGESISQEEYEDATGWLQCNGRKQGRTSPPIKAHAPLRNQATRQRHSTRIAPFNARDSQAYPKTTSVVIWPQNGLVCCAHQRSYLERQHPTGCRSKARTGLNGHFPSEPDSKHCGYQHSTSRKSGEIHSH